MIALPTVSPFAPRDARVQLGLALLASLAACIEPAPEPMPPPVMERDAGASADAGTSAQPGDGVPYYDRWSRSPHADPSSRAFTYWNEQGEVPIACARCHSAAGFRDFIGEDGSLAGSVQTAPKAGGTIDCETCHNDAASALSAVTFPSGETVSELGSDARCMTCHQGRASTDSVDTAIAAQGELGDDEASSELGFVNIHYRPAAATLYAGQARGGYQYAGHVYDRRFRHVEGFDSCVGCHDPHSTQVRFDRCTECHQGASDLAGVRDIRMIASQNHDYAGDGNTSQGLYYELQAMAARLEALIRRYAEQRDAPVCYGSSHPYFFNDQDRDGACSAEESVADNRYRAFTPRLLRAAYNYQVARQDPGAFAHNGKYVIQLLYDSIADLAAALTPPENVSALVRTDNGHFDGASPAARNWDESESVSASCSRCHGGAQGFHFFQQYGVGMEVLETANGLECATCHANYSGYDLIEVTQTTFPANRIHELDGNDDLCAGCHSGRASTASIDAAIARGGMLSFQNVHGGPAAGVLYGSRTAVGYQYEGKSYAGKLSHQGGTRCTTCHDAAASKHTFRVRDVWQARCDVCHGDYDEASEVRLTHLLDHDGDGDTRESLAGELETMARALLDALHAHSGTPPLCYSSRGFPYFHRDEDNSGPICDESEASASNRFTAWTPALLRAGHNYKLSQSDKGAYAHNFPYVAQLLYDSLEDLTGSAPAMMIRP
jgi:hypothetical protein